MTAAFIILAAANWTFISHNEYFFGAYGALTPLQTHFSALFDTILRTLDTTPAYNVIVAVFALLCGLVVFLFLEITAHSAHAFHESIEDVHFAKGNYRKMIVEGVLVRAVLRVASFAIWLVYAIFWAGIVAPLCVALTQIGLADILTETGWLLLLASFALLVASLHLHVILLRLTLLRPRVFGGQEAIANALS